MPVYQHLQIIVSCLKLVGTYSKHLYLSQSKIELKKNPTAQAQAGRAVVQQIQSPKLGSLSTAKMCSGADTHATSHQLRSGASSTLMTTWVCVTCEYSEPETPTERRQKAGHHVVSNELMTREETTLIPGQRCEDNIRAAGASVSGSQVHRWSPSLQIL